MDYGIDIIGKIAVLRFKDNKNKLKIARRVMQEHKNVHTILERSEKVHGRLRTIKTKFLLGNKTKETIHRESGCYFKLNVDKCYFSPRLSNERLEVANMVSGKVLVLFVGVAPYPIIIAKNPNVKKVVGVELGRECCKYAKENVKLNKLVDKVEIVQGDVNRVLGKLKDKFDYIVMPRPQLKDTFLPAVFKIAKKPNIIYYDFGKDAEEIVGKIQRDAEQAGKKIKIENVKIAGEIAPYAYRWRVDLRVLN
jgi:tRNA (guanine37-N1)-methyltransferase